MRKREISATFIERKYKTRSFKFITFALITALSGVIGFIIGILYQSSLIIACSALIVSIGALLGNLANYWLEKSKEREPDIETKEAILEECARRG